LSSRTGLAKIEGRIAFRGKKHAQPKGRSDDTIRNEGLDFAELFFGARATQPEGVDFVSMNGRCWVPSFYGSLFPSNGNTNQHCAVNQIQRDKVVASYTDISLSVRGAEWDVRYGCTDRHNIVGTDMVAADTVL
jgi:hypothetical protein